MVSSESWLWVFRAGVGFLLLAGLLFLLGFATDHWHDDDSVHYGLWSTCDGAKCSEFESDELPAYHIATQAFQTMAVVFFALSPIVHLFVYCCKTRKDTGWRSRILDIGYSSGILFHLCSLLIFGLENPTPQHFSWSYRMSCASSAISFFGILMIILSRSKALYKFTFRSVSRSAKRKTAATTSESVSPPDRRFDETANYNNNYNNNNRTNPLFHPQDKVVVSSTSEQSSPHHSTRVPDTNVNINININADPSNSNIALSHQHQHQLQYQQQSSIDYNYPSGATPTHSSYPTGGSPRRLPPIVPEAHQRLHPSPSESLVDYPLTQVRPAPKSSIAPYTSPTHKKTFGPAHRRRTLELVDNSDVLHSSEGGNNRQLPVPSISGLVMPSAPPYDETDLERDNPPPSYSDAVSKS